jgi:hypothetical protein
MADLVRWQRLITSAPPSFVVHSNFPPAGVERRRYRVVDFRLGRCLRVLRIGRVSVAIRAELTDSADDIGLVTDTA